MPTAIVQKFQTRRRLLLLNGWRLLIAVWYFGGSAIHADCALFRPEIYSRFGHAPLYPLMGHMWATVFLPNITTFALLLALFELIVGILLLSHGRAVKIGLTSSLAFNLFLIQLGLVYPADPGSLHDFACNRLPNVLFIVVQAPLFWITFERSLRRFKQDPKQQSVALNA